MKKSSPFLGFSFALITAMAWGSLPIALKQVLNVMNTQTIVWYRFVVATLVLLILLSYKKNLPKLTALFPRYLWLALLGVVGLAGNFFLFNSSLKYIEPAFAQIFIHLSSFMMLIVGIFVFKEKLGLHQKIGLLVLFVGLGMFFNDRLHIFTELNQYSIGIGLSIAAAVMWVGYGLAQKLMLRRFSSQQILLLMYFGCALVFTPFAQLDQVQQLTPFFWGCFIYCCLNTLFGYGAYAEALNHWDVSKVSVVITLVPLFTILFSHLAHSLGPDIFTFPELNIISYIGAFVVVFGAIFSTLGHKILPAKSR